LTEDGFNFQQSMFHRYAELGWNPIPISEKKKKPEVKWERYQTDRSTDDQWAWWSKKWPEGNIAIITGAVSGVFVIDQDSDEACPSLMKLLPLTATATTSKGRHFYFRIPKGVEIKTKIRPPGLPGLDIKGEGGYVLVPPSIHPDGPAYMWEREPEDGIAELPPAALKMILDAQGLIESERINGETRWKVDLDGLKGGEGRNNGGARVAGKIVESLPEEMWDTIGWAGFQGWNFKNAPPMALKELKSIFDSICKRERNKARMASSKGYTLRELWKSNPQPPDVLLTNVLTNGLTMLLGHPKSGKSILSIQMALGVASGQVPWEQSLETLAYYGQEFKMKQGEVLYLALEDSDSRLNKRTRILADLMKQFPDACQDRLTLYTEWPSMYEGGVIGIENWLIGHPKCRLVIIDTLTAFAGAAASKGGDIFAAQYRMVRPLFDLGQKMGVCVLVIHHSRKGKTMDPTDAVAGTNGIPAAVDTLLNVVRDYGEEGAVISILSRDIESYELHLSQNGNMKWKLVVPPPPEE
jgi:hypothetical protein